MQPRRTERLLFAATLALIATTITVGGPAVAGDVVDDRTPFDIVAPTDAVVGRADGLPLGGNSRIDGARAEPKPLKVPSVDTGLTVNEVAADPARGVLYTSVSMNDGTYPGTIATIDPDTGDVLKVTPIVGEPNALEIAPDGNALYVGLDSSAQIVQLLLPDLTPGWSHDFGPDRNGITPLRPDDIEVSPYDPDLVVMSIRGCCSPGHRGIMAFRDGVALPNVTDEIYSSDRIEFGASPETVYGFESNSTGHRLVKLRVDVDGVTLDGTESRLFGSKDFAFADGLIYSDTGVVLDPTSWPPIPAGDFEQYSDGYRRVVAIESAARRATFIEDGNFDYLVAHDLDTRAITEVWELPDSIGFRFDSLTPVDEGVLAFVPRFNAGHLVLLYPGILRGSNGEFTALTPRRVLDTRRGVGTAGVIGPIGADSRIDVQVTGLAGIPETGVKAVVMNVTAVDPTDGTFLSIYPRGIGQPDISNLNTAAGKNRANLVTVGVGAGGKVTVYNAFGSTHVLFDVAGYYADGDGQDGARYRAVDPVRIADNRHNTGGIGIGKLGAGETATIHVAGRHGVPATGAAAVVLNVTSSQSTAQSFMTVSPGDVSRPDASNLNVAPGDDTPNQVIVRVPVDGTIDIYNDAGETFLIVDLVGYYENGGDTQRGRFLAANPYRAVDTRRSSPFPAPGDLWAGDILYYGSETDTFSAYALNVTVTGTIGAGFVSTYPYPGDPPTTSTLNYGPGDTVANHAIVSTGPFMGFLNENGRTHLIVDIFGAFT